MHVLGYRDGKSSLVRLGRRNGWLGGLGLWKDGDGDGSDTGAVEEWEGEAGVVDTADGTASWGWVPFLGILPRPVYVVLFQAVNRFFEKEIPFWNGDVV